jgi:hypothetical protein
VIEPERDLERQATAIGRHRPQPDRLGLGVRDQVEAIGMFDPQVSRIGYDDGVAGQPPAHRLQQLHRHLSGERFVAEPHPRWRA